MGRSRPESNKTNSRIQHMLSEASPALWLLSCVCSLVITIFNFKIIFKTLLEEALEQGLVENKPALARVREEGRDGQAGLSHLFLFGELISKAR